MRKIFALPFGLVTPMFALCLMAAPLAAEQITETFSHNADSFQMQFVKIGDVGNSGKNAGLSRPIGDVNYEYWIGKFEVDAWQIAVGNASGIVGVSVADWNHREYTFGTNPPATGISWQEAARFVNWMNISKGYSPAYKFASYDIFNSYDPNYTGLNDVMMLWDPNDVGYNPNNPFRNSRARYFLPSLDEWFKAAFYDPTLNSGNGGYWDFPTTSNTAPTPVPGGAVGAVYGSQTGPANVDDAGSLSWYGTMAQGGNVWELAETAFDLNNNDINKNRAVVGGGWGSPATQISSDFMFSSTPNAPNDSYGIGFRVAMVVEPPDSDLDQDGVNYYRELKDGTNPNDATSFNPLSKGLVAYYPFDGNAKDESGGSNHLVNKGAVLANDRFGSDSSALSFEPTTGALSEKKIPISGNSDRTIALWLKVKQNPPVDIPPHASVEGSIIGWGQTGWDAGTGRYSGIIYVPYYINNSNPYVANHNIQFVGWYSDTAILTNPSDLQGKWHHLTVVYSTDIAQTRYYLNGRRQTVNFSVSSDPNNTTTLDTVSTELAINSESGSLLGGWKGYAGQIDDVRIYNRTLSDTEVAKLFYEEALTDVSKTFLTATPSLMGHYSQADYNANRTNGQIDVTTNPSAFSLFTQAQFDGNRTAGQSDVINNPMSYGLYTSDSIMDLRMGGLMVQRIGTNAVVSFQPQTTTDLAQPFTNNGTPITNTIPMPGNKGFIRINAKP